MIQMIFFEAQTGIYKRHDWESNFHHYRLRNSRIPIDNGYTIPWLDENIAKAKIGPNGLDFPPEFLLHLDMMEKAADQAIQRLHDIGDVSEVPRRQDGSLYHDSGDSPIME